MRSGEKLNKSSQGEGPPSLISQRIACCTGLVTQAPCSMLSTVVPACNSNVGLGWRREDP